VPDAITVNVAVWPTTTFWLGGCPTIVGGDVGSGAEAEVPLLVQPVRVKTDSARHSQARRVRFGIELTSNVIKGLTPTSSPTATGE
jgi:hypothetical protein